MRALIDYIGTVNILIASERQCFLPRFGPGGYS
jgi:hypothetical protein